jgi:hypothetical protein
MKKNGLILCVFVIIVFVYGCASTGFLMEKPKLNLFGNAYPSKDDNEVIDVFITSKPTREYTEFAQILCNDTDDKWNMQQVQKKAREIGADGIIIIGKAGFFGIGYSNLIVSEEYGISAIAIKYK